VAAQQAAPVSDESALDACARSRRCAIQIDDLYLYFYLYCGPYKRGTFLLSISSPIINRFSKFFSLSYSADNLHNGMGYIIITM